MIKIHTYTPNGWIENTGDISLIVNQRTLNQNLILFNYEYTKGDESGFELSYAFKYSIIEGKSFFMTQENGGNVSKKILSVRESGSEMIPIPCPLSSDEVEISVSLVDSAGSPGSLEVWLMPDCYLF